MPRPYAACMPDVDPDMLYNIPLVSRKFKINRATVYRYFAKGLQFVIRNKKKFVYGSEMQRFYHKNSPERQPI